MSQFHEIWGHTQTLDNHKHFKIFLCAFGGKPCLSVEFVDFDPWVSDFPLSNHWGIDDILDKAAASEGRREPSKSTSAEAVKQKSIARKWIIASKSSWLFSFLYPSNDKIRL